MDVNSWAADLRSSDDERCQQATNFLENCGPPPLSELATIAALLTDSHPDVVYWGATLVGRLGAKAAPATSSLVAALEANVAPHARERVVWALGEIGPGATAALPALRQAAQSDSPRLARLAQQAIQRIGA